MLISLFDWAKIIKNPIENTGKLKLFLLFSFWTEYGQLDFLN